MWPAVIDQSAINTMQGYSRSTCPSPHCGSPSHSHFWGWEGGGGHPEANTTLLLLQLLPLVSMTLGVCFSWGSCSRFQCPILSLTVLKGNVENTRLAGRGHDSSGASSLLLLQSPDWGRGTVSRERSSRGFFLGTQCRACSPTFPTVLFCFLATSQFVGVLVPWSGIKTGPLAVKVQSSNHWTTRTSLPTIVKAPESYFLSPTRMLLASYIWK